LSELQDIAKYNGLHRDNIYTLPLVISSSFRLNSCGLCAFSVLGHRLRNSA